MDYYPSPRISPSDILVTDEVIAYISKRKCDFRISTSCGGPLLLPISYKPPKDSDLPVRAGEYTIYVSIHQAPYLPTIGMDLVPLFVDRR